MRKVNLDLEFEKWKKKNEKRLIERFLEIHGFNDMLEEEWQRYQNENEPIDKSNKQFREVRI